MASDPSKRHALDVPPVYFASAIALLILLHRIMPIVDLIDWPWSWIGLVPIALGIGIAVWAARLFSRAGTGLRPFTPSTALVQTGPYRFTRNPMYVGMMLVLTGAVLLAGSLGSALVLPVFFWLIHRRFVLPEEDHMTRHFGEHYLSFTRAVRRWL